MMTDQEVAKILKQNRIVFDPKKRASQFSGVAPFLTFLEKANLKQRLQKEFGIFRGRSMLQLLIGIILGARNMNDVGKVGKDDLISEFLKNPVEEAQLGRDVRNWSPEEIQKLHDFNTALAIYDLAQRVTHQELVIFDIDATSVEKYGQQEGVEHGYVGKDDPENCYQYLFLRLGNRNTFFYGTIRSGSAHSENDVRFYIKAPMSSTRLLMAQTSLDINWSAYNEKGESFTSRKTNTANTTML